MAKINVLTITFTDGSKEQYRDCVISVQEGILYCDAAAAQVSVVNIR